MWETLSGYCTKEVLTLAACIAAVFAGWKACSKGAGLFSAISQKFSILAALPAVLFISGIGEAGLGVGELATRYANRTVVTSASQKGLPDTSLAALAEKCQDKTMAKIILDYAKTRDGHDQNYDVNIITGLLERQFNDKGVLLANKDTHDAYVKLVRDFMVYMKERREEAAKTVTIGTEEPVVAAIQPTPNADSLMSMPWAFALLGLGVGSTLCGISMHRANREKKTA